MSPCEIMMGSILVAALAIGSIFPAMHLANWIKARMSFQNRKDWSSVLVLVPAAAIMIFWIATSVRAEPKPCHATAKSFVDFLH